MTAQFGPSALATPANGVTVVRIVVTAPLLVMILDRAAAWPAFGLWVVLAVTDGVDGYLARRHGSTRSGAFLDPLADKVLVLGAMAALVAVDVFWWLPVAIIAVREFGVQALRSYWGRQGLAIPARSSAKAKTVVQDLAVGLALLPPVADHVPALASSVLWVSVLLTVVSGAQYVLEGRAATTTAGARGKQVLG